MRLHYRIYPSWFPYPLMSSRLPFLYILATDWVGSAGAPSQHVFHHSGYLYAPTSSSHYTDCIFLTLHLSTERGSGKGCIVHKRGLINWYDPTHLPNENHYFSSWSCIRKGFWIKASWHKDIYTFLYNFPKEKITFDVQFEPFSPSRWVQF